MKSKRINGRAGAWRLEKNVPIPSYVKGYPWHEMAVGDCLYITDRSREMVKNTVRDAARRLGFKFVCRAVGMTETRVWRVK